MVHKKIWINDWIILFTKDRCEQQNTKASKSKLAYFSCDRICSPFIDQKLSSTNQITNTNKVSLIFK